MLTPRFKLSQDENRVFVVVHAPYTSIGDTEIDVDGENFLFVSSPYFLRLKLPARVIDSETSKGSYNAESGDFELIFEKETPGEHFENLDMITSLLAPRDIPDINPALVEILDEDGITFDDTEDDSNNTPKYSFGFANKLTVEFSDIGNEFPQVFELKVPGDIAIHERNNLRVQYENEKCSPDHYLADLYDVELLEPYLSPGPLYDSSEFDNVEFTADDISLLKELPNKHYLLTKTEKNQVMLGLIDILYGFCYDQRTTSLESTVESSWTINKLSSTLSWFCVFKDVKDVLIACYRRALIFPIFRNFELCQKVKDDLLSLFRRGKKFIIKCFIKIHSLFNVSVDPRYILNQLYIKDYLVFLQKCRNEEFDELYNNIANVEITKNDLELELEELEHAAELVQQEETEIMENEMAIKMAAMNLLPGLKKTYITHDEESDEYESTSSDSSSDSLDSSDDTSDLDSDDDEES